VEEQHFSRGANALNKRRTIHVEIDDISVGTRMTVLRNPFHVDFGVCGTESDYLKGTVLQVVAISLPYLLVQAFDPVRGRANVSVDVRQHWFGKVGDAYADAVIRGCDKPDEEQVPF
jgi:hypothetical protein